MKKIITHDGRFHTDEIFAVAVVQLFLDGESEKYEVIRTRDNEIIKTGDFIVDVGGEYDASRNMFDHHQIGGAGTRENDMPYAAFGLVWKQFGESLCKSPEVADRIDRKLVQYVDAADVGIDVYEPIFDHLNIYTVGTLFRSYMPTWKEDDLDADNAFAEVVDIAKRVLQREIIVTTDELDGECKMEEAYRSAKDKRIVVIDKYYSGKGALRKYNEPLFVVGPRKDGGWVISAIRDNENTFDSRKDLPESWAGKKGKELADITGVEDAMFCHNARFLAGAGSREGAIRLAKIAADA